MKKNKAGFTLIEIMVAIAIIGIMAAAVIVSMQEYGKKARSTKVLAQLSSVIPNMVSCWGNGKTVKNPASGGAICREPSMGGADVASYGYYPSLSGDLSSYSYGVIDIDNNAWHFGAESSSDSKAVCCNVTMKSCKEVTQPLSDSGGSPNCTDSIPAN